MPERGSSVEFGARTAGSSVPGTGAVEDRPARERSAHTMFVAAGLIALALVGYLMVTLFHPEKF